MADIVSDTVPPRLHLEGLAYVPGRVEGVLRRGPSISDPDDILIIRMDEVDAVSGRPGGILVVDGAPLSHRMIRLLGIGVPTVIVDARQGRQLPPGTRAVLDGASGRVNDSASHAVAECPAPAIPQAGHPVHTADGVPVRLLASVRHAGAARQAVAAGAAAIGLVRSEFLEPADGAQPDADYFARTFAELCNAAAPLAVTFRLLDACPDKRPAWLPLIDGFGSALGLQGARLFAVEPVHGVVEAQLQAIAALGAHHTLRVIIPYLTRYEELQHWAAWARALLPPTISLGAMVETPASALDLGNWFDVVDFVALGCNDLMQGLFAADRDRPELAGFLDPYAPLLYRFLQQMAKAADTHLHQVQLCGVLPQLRGVLPILLGLGYRTFSVDAVHIPYLAHAVRELQLSDAERLAGQVCHARSSAEVAARLGLSPTACRPFPA